MNNLSKGEFIYQSEMQHHTASSTQVENHERFNPAAMPQDLGPRSAKSVRPREVSGAARRAKKKRERQNKKRGRK